MKDIGIPITKQVKGLYLVYTTWLRYMENPCQQHMQSLLPKCDIHHPSLQEILPSCGILESDFEVFVFSEALMYS